MWSYAYPNNVANDGTLIAGCDPAAFNAAAGSSEQKCKAACGIRYCFTLEQTKVYPTPIFETILSLIGFGLLYIWRKKIKITGMLFFLYMIYNGVERFFIEGIRVNERYDFIGMKLSQAQFISIAFFVIGMIGAVYMYLNSKKEHESSKI
jgi:prolipoprotein diacylglyceryltransferase